jgi:hypothetical protein
MAGDLTRRGTQITGFGEPVDPASTIERERANPPITTEEINILLIAIVRTANGWQRK